MSSDRGRHGATSVIYVLIANLAGVVAEIVEQTIQQQPDIKLLGNVKDWEEIALAAAETDVLVLSADDGYSPPEACLRLLSNYPNLKILVLTAHSNEAVAYWRALHCNQLQILSSQALIESIREIHSVSPF